MADVRAFFESALEDGNASGLFPEPGEGNPEVATVGRT